MSKVLYAFKIWMLRGQFLLKKKEEKGLVRMCTFFARVYAKAWTEATFPAQAPRLNLELIKALSIYERIGPEVGEVALAKLSGHLWYVSEELIGLCFFDSAASSETKMGMGAALLGEEAESEESAHKRVTLPKKSIRDFNPDDL